MQQQLVEARARIDRHAARLQRMQRLVVGALASAEHETGITLAEGVADVFETQLTVVALRDDGGPPRVAVFGAAEDAEVAATVGARLFELPPVTPTPPGRAVPRRDPRLDADALARLGPALDLGEAVTCADRALDPRVVILTGNTRAGVGVYDPVTSELADNFVVLAQLLFALLENRRGSALIARQVEEIRASEARLALVLKGTNEGWWDWDLVTGRTFFSERWWSMLAIAPPAGGEAPKTWLDFVAEDEVGRVRRQVTGALEGAAEELMIETRLQCSRAAGPLPVLVRATILRDAAGVAVRCAGSTLDLSEQKRQEAHIHQLAFYDALTELPNRRLLFDRLQRVLSGRARSEERAALIMLDLDRFKAINDTHGHDVGDLLLRSVARRLEATVRPTDTVARLGGDEYVVLLEALGGTDEEAIHNAEAVGRKILAALGKPYDLRGVTHHHTASVGIAIASDDVSTPETMLKRADLALYQAKDAGRDTLRFFHAGLQAHVDARATLEARLRAGLARGEFALHYQPQVDARGTILGAEALLRWFPSEGASSGPAEFIPIAEDSGLILALGRWVLEHACLQLAAWQAEGRGEGFAVSVNVSARQFLEPDFVDHVRVALERAGASPSGLVLELTESAVLTKLDVAVDHMRALRSLGVRFSLDDFGTGYSSLSYLKLLPLDEVKLDRSFVRDIATDRDDAAIVRAILVLCSSLDIPVVAEGVEAEEQLRFLHDGGCRRFQGYYFGRPVPPRVFWPA